MEEHKSNKMLPKSYHGRGTSNNPANRFEEIWSVRDSEWNDPEDPAPKTQFFKDTPRSIITYNDSPDLPFTVSINPYRGCEHGCIYCYARPTHEYLGLSAGLDFESKIFVKEDAAKLLRKEFFSARWQPQIVTMSGVTDPYQPIERRLGITRQCLEVFVEFRNPVAIITKNYLVTRDIDLLEKLNQYNAVAIYISVTTLEHKLSGLMEPRASRPQDRLSTIKELKERGIPVGILLAPVIPALTDHEIPAILSACAKVGAQFAGYVVLRLPYGVKSLFEDWLTQHFPDRKEKVLNRIRSLRGGKLNDPQFSSRLRGEGVFAEQIEALFAVACKKVGIHNRGPVLSTSAFQRLHPTQLTLFDS